MVGATILPNPSSRAVLQLMAHHCPLQALTLRRDVSGFFTLWPSGLGFAFRPARALPEPPPEARCPWAEATSSARGLQFLGLGFGGLYKGPLDSRGFRAMLWSSAFGVSGF